MADKQIVRNSLSAIEDEARSMRRTMRADNEFEILSLIANLAQIIREDIVQ